MLYEMSSDDPHRRLNSPIVHRHAGDKLGRQVFVNYGGTDISYTLLRGARKIAPPLMLWLKVLYDSLRNFFQANANSRYYVGLTTVPTTRKLRH